VLHIIAGLDIGNHSGGAEAFAVRLLQNLDASVFELAVFAMQGYESATEDSWVAQLQAQGITVLGRPLLTGATSQKVKTVCAALWASLGQFMPHILNSHSERADLLSVAAKRLHPLHPKIVQTVHLDAQWQTRPWFGALFTQFIAPLQFDAHMVVAEAIRQRLDQRPLARLLHKKAVLGYNGIDERWFQAENNHAAVPPPNFPKARPLIGAMGRLTEQKGFDDLLQALALVLPQLPVHLVIVGAGPLEAALKAQAQMLGMAAHVDFLGQRSDAQTILRQLDLFVSASRWEGFPTVIIEAMSQGIPVIATDIAGSRELVVNGQTGMLVPPRAPQQLADAIRDLLSNVQKAQTMATQAKTLATQFTIQTTAVRYSEVYTKLMGYPT
jgi:glycosyltransferase involved in cell wall biosynthesis